MGCLLLSPWGIASNALEYLWHLYKPFLEGIINGQASTVYCHQSFLSFSTSLVDHCCFCPQFWASSSPRPQTSSCMNFTPEKKHPLTSLCRIASWEMQSLWGEKKSKVQVRNGLGGETPLGEWLGHPAISSVGGDLAITSVTHLSLRRIWMIWSFFAPLPNIFLSHLSLPRFLQHGRHHRESIWPLTQSVTSD